jgi:hypothetical protein
MNGSNERKERERQTSEIITQITKQTRKFLFITLLNYIQYRKDLNSYWWITYTVILQKKNELD